MLASAVSRSLALFAVCGLISACEVEATPSAPNQDTDTLDNASDDPDTEAPGDLDTADNDTGPIDEPKAVTAPANWNPTPDMVPQFVHFTWQRDPSTTLTVQWQLPVDSVAPGAGYVPKVWIVPADTLPLKDGQPDPAGMKYSAAYVATGTGLPFTANLRMPNGTIRRNVEFTQWEVEITGLRPNTRYYYRAGTWQGFEDGAFVGAELSDAFPVATGLPKGSREPFRFFSGGDSRSGNQGIRDNIVRLRDMGADFWLFNGDMSNGGSQREWFDWFEAMAPLMKTTVLMPVQGNHEIQAHLYYNQFALPVEPEMPDDLKEYAWHFVYGNALFLGMCSNTEDLAEVQKTWMEGIFKKYENDPDIDWRFVMHHHSVYSASTAHGSTDYLIRHWEPVFNKYKVDMTFCGHDHNYERSIPWANGAAAQPGQHGVVYIVAGAFYTDEPYGNGRQAWTAISEHGNRSNYAVISVEGKKMKLTAFDGSHAKMDEYEVTKP